MNRNDRRANSAKAKHVRVIPITSDEMGEALWEGLKLHMPIGNDGVPFAILPPEGRRNLTLVAAHVINAALAKINGAAIPCPEGEVPS